MRYFLSILAFFICSLSFGQAMTYEEWNEEAKTNIRLLPACGHAEKTEKQKQADREFIEASIKTDGTPKKASDHIIRTGWTYFYNGDIKTAMYRFNQGLMLDPTNEDAYWGFGVFTVISGMMRKRLRCMIKAWQ